MKPMVKLDSTTMLELRLRERGINLKKISTERIMLTAKLTVSEKDRFDKLAEYRHVRPNDLVNTIIKNFTFDFDDIKFFHGMKRRSMIDTVKGLFCKPEDKVYVTFHVNKESSDKIGAFRSKFDMRRGLIITHMIQKYLRDNRNA